MERAVIGLELCPFAAGVYRSGLVRFRASEAGSTAALLEELRSELLLLSTADAALCETTLLVHPYVLTDFLEYNDFLAVCDAAVAELGLEGELQVASFHPQYRFAGAGSDDVENHTNRSPYPTLHLLRESSIERVLAAMPNPESIYENNMRRLRELGPAGWRALWSDPAGGDP